MSIYYNHWDYWQLNHKITVDYNQRLIFLNNDVTSFDIKTDLYSDIKELWALSPIAYDYNKFRPPVRVIGGDDTVAGQKAGDIYFMQYDWRVVYDPTKTRITGVLFSDDYDTPWLYSKDLTPIYPAVVSSLVTAVQPTLEGLNIPTTGELADAVWDFPVRELTDQITPEQFWNFLLSSPLAQGSAGEKLKQVLTTGNFIALQK